MQSGYIRIANADGRAEIVLRMRIKNICNASIKMHYKCKVNTSAIQLRTSRVEEVRKLASAI
jgi:hypothetical protein